jgi:hypothetical protein
MISVIAADFAAWILIVYAFAALIKH